MSDYIGTDSLAFLSIDGVYKAMGHKGGRNAENPEFTDHCFTGDYPTLLRDQNNDKNIRQLSFLYEPH